VEPKVLEELSPDECQRLLEGEHFGRLAFLDRARDMPMIIPINYVFHHGSVVLRSAEGSKLEAARRDVAAAAFEIDGVNEEQRLGWSVVVRGYMHPVTDLQDLAELEETPLVSWAPGERPHYIRLQPKTLTGRRISIRELPSNWWG
jgi:uncharacterized protein